MKRMTPRGAGVLRKMIKNATAYLFAKPRPPPLKCVILQYMYKIESAMDVAINYTYASRNKPRERGYWEWCCKDPIRLSKTVDPDEEGSSNKIWIEFPIDISQQIEAMYCRREADLQRPYELVEIYPISYKQWKSDKKNIKKGNGVEGKSDKDARKPWKTNQKNVFHNGRKFGIVTYPRGYFTDDEIKTQTYVPYSKDTDGVYVMELNPKRTTRNKVMWWENGPNFVVGETTYAKYTNTAGVEYYKWSMIIDRYKSGGVWYIVSHPMPSRRRNIFKTEPDIKFYKKDQLKLRSEGKYFKCYVESDNGKHYVIDINSMKTKCIEEQIIYKIRRFVVQKTAKEIWDEACKFADSYKDKKNYDVPWNQPKQQDLKPLPILDYRDFKNCGFIDIGNQDMDEFEQYIDGLRVDNNDSDNETNGNDDINGTMNPIDIDSSVLHNDINEEIPKLSNELEIGEKVKGKVIKIFGRGVWVDVGLIKPALLKMDQIKCPISVIKMLAQKEKDRIKRENDAEAERLKQQKKEAKKEAKRRKKAKKLMELQQSTTQTNTKTTKGTNGTNGTKGGKAGNDKKVAEPGSGKKKRRRKRKKKKPTNDGDNSSVYVDSESKTDDQRSVASINEFDYGFETKPKVTRNKAYTLPKCINNMRQCSLMVGDIVELYVEDIDYEMNEVELTQFKPLTSFKYGDEVTGYVKSVIPYACFVDIGCEFDAFLHRNNLEFGLQNRIIFDCQSAVNVGDKLDLKVIKVDTWSDKIEVTIDISKKAPDRLILPDDFDESKAVIVSIFGLLPDDVNNHIFTFLGRGDIHRCRDVCVLFERLIDEGIGLKYEIEELKCFHTKETFRDQILGMGVSVERYPNSSIICNIDPKLDLLSAKSFHDYGIRMNVWKEPFSFWLPVYINVEHGKRAMPWCKRMICSMMSYKKYKQWSPYLVLKVIPTLMNTMVVKVMKGELHESIVALEGYTMFYHLLLSFVLEYPFLQTFIDKVIGDFLENETNRGKKIVPSLGEWIALLSVSNKYSWRDVATVYLRENFDRHVKWILQAHKNLLDDNVRPNARIHKSFLASQVSLKLCMFHVAFLRLFRFSQRSGTVMTVKQAKKKLDRLHGRPTNKMKILLQKQTKRIKKIKTWNEFFNGIGVKCPNNNELYSWLVEALYNSERRGYHKRYWFFKKKKRNGPNLNAGFDRFDDMADAWSAKQFGSDVQQAIKKKEKKLSIKDQMILQF